VNEAFEDNGTYRNSLFFQKMGADYIAEAFTNARAADPAADLYYNDYNISPGGAKLNAVLDMVDDFKQRGIPIDGVGFQMHIYMGWPNASTLKNSFAEVVARGLKVKITELDIPINNPFDGSYNFPNNYVAEFTPTIANAQKIRFCEVVKAYMETVPEHLRGGLTVWGVNDGSSWLMNQIFGNKHADWPLLFNDDLQPKPAYYGVANGLTNQPCAQ
jgi:endo-1,4-beta-xylanase